MKIVNKLVRDRIPEIIKTKNKKECAFRVLDDKEYLNELNLKLQEELNEYLDSGDILELADLEEVILALVDFKKVSRKEFENIRQEKFNERGGFKNKIFLETIED